MTPPAARPAADAPPPRAARTPRTARAGARTRARVAGALGAAVLLSAAPAAAAAPVAAAAPAAPSAPTAPPAGADGIRDRQWALRALRAEEAWGTTRGEGVTVAVLDTGVDAGHPDLEGQVLDGVDLVGMGAGPGDARWAKHGTAMAGIIAGHGHGTNRRSGVMGLAPAARILPVRVILEEGDPGRDKARQTKGGALAEGIRWATDHGAHVINLSLGDDSESAHHEAAEDEAIQYALAKGVVVVASAGNGGHRGNPVSYPAAYPGVIAVTAVDRRGRRPYFSTRNWYATVSAPGLDIVIADPSRKYYESFGTSAAAAFVSGAVALVRSAHPGLSPAQVKKLLEETATYGPAAGRDDARGHGWVDPVAALQAARSMTPAAPLPTPAGYRAQHFGPGPEPVHGREPRYVLPAAAAAGGGAVLLALAAVLGRRRTG
ncbi:type VII secretion-associated serine protease mycosin [Streptomyces sp. NPDC012888]|uniref:type VII secretion-associated serine protease mycosin n=1 Tax=Streptomyces sp. NPDC012888 TaxID=3364855 RepID=UPI0036CB3EE9